MAAMRLRLSGDTETRNYVLTTASPPDGMAGGREETLARVPDV